MSSLRVCVCVGLVCVCGEICVCNSICLCGLEEDIRCSALLLFTLFRKDKSLLLNLKLMHGHTPHKCQGYGSTRMSHHTCVLMPGLLYARAYVSHSPSLALPPPLLFNLLLLLSLLPSVPVLFPLPPPCKHSSALPLVGQMPSCFSAKLDSFVMVIDPGLLQLPIMLWAGLRTSHVGTWG